MDHIGLLHFFHWIALFIGLSMQQCCCGMAIKSYPPRFYCRGKWMAESTRPRMTSYQPRLRKLVSSSFTLEEQDIKLYLSFPSFKRFLTNEEALTFAHLSRSYLRARDVILTQWHVVNQSWWEHPFLEGDIVESFSTKNGTTKKSITDHKTTANNVTNSEKRGEKETRTFLIGNVRDPRSPLWTAHVQASAYDVEDIIPVLLHNNGAPYLQVLMLGLQPAMNSATSNESFPNETETDDNPHQSNNPSPPRDLWILIVLIAACTTFFGVLVFRRSRNCCLAQQGNMGCSNPNSYTRHTAGSGRNTVTWDGSRGKLPHPLEDLNLVEEEVCSDNGADMLILNVSMSFSSSSDVHSWASTTPRKNNSNINNRSRGRKENLATLSSEEPKDNKSMGETEHLTPDISDQLRDSDVKKCNPSSTQDSKASKASCCRRETFP